MSKVIDRTNWVMAEHGVPDSRLTVIKRVEDRIYSNGNKYAQWLCECNCKEHNKIILTTGALRFTKSCGCIQKEKASEHCKNFHKVNKYDLTSCPYGIGWTSNTNKEFYFDLEDYEKIKDYCWSERKDSDSQYTSLMAKDSTTHKLIKMHYLIFEKYCDHINRNTLDNRKENLRKANPKENGRNMSIPSNNKSGIIGVHWDKDWGKWVAQININGKRTRLRGYDKFENAVIARLKAELQYWGEFFAPQRHLFEQYKVKETNNAN